MSFNKWIGFGRLGKDPELRYLPSGQAVCNFSIACTETWKDKQTGERKESTEWVTVSVFGPQAEFASKWLRKGARAHVTGKLKTRKWTDKNGQDRYSTEIAADEIAPIDWPEQGQQQDSRPPRGHSDVPPGANGGGMDFDDDIPFAPPACLDGLWYRRGA